MGLSNPSPLCCCEYIDNEGNRNHILECCCNCTAFDAAVDSVVCCRNKKSARWTAVVRTLEDRMRIPWIGGAAKCTLDVILPVFLLPLMFLVSTESAISTAITFTSGPIIICQLYAKYLHYIPHTKFFIIWTYTSFALILLIYEIDVVPSLEIRASENMCFIGLFVLASFCLYKVKSVKGFVLAQSDVEAGEKGDGSCSSCKITVPPRSGHCRLCQTCIYKRELHCLWFGCCIGAHNLLWFLLCLLSLFGALVYSADLILTTVCRPVQLWGSILIPEDCSDVYYETRYALCFVTGLYSLVISVLVLWALIRHCWMVTLGITGNEWRSMSLGNKCRLGITANRPYSRGPICNWLDLLLGRNH